MKLYSEVTNNSGTCPCSYFGSWGTDLIQELHKPYGPQLCNFIACLFILLLPCLTYAASPVDGSGENHMSRVNWRICQFFELTQLHKTFSTVHLLYLWQEPSYYCVCGQINSASPLKGVSITWTAKYNHFQSNDINANLPVHTIQHPMK